MKSPILITGASLIFYFFVLKSLIHILNDICLCLGFIVTLIVFYSLITPSGDPKVGILMMSFENIRSFLYTMGNSVIFIISIFFPRKMDTEPQENSRLQDSRNIKKSKISNRQLKAFRKVQINRKKWRINSRQIPVMEIRRAFA